MAKRKRQAKGYSQSSKGKRKRSAGASPAIPIVVGVVLVIIAGGILLSLGSWRSTAGDVAANPTAPALSTMQMPYPDVSRISLEEAQQKLALGEILMVDVRSKTAYDSLHIEGAISLPEGEIEDRLDELDRERSIVLYCT